MPDTGLYPEVQALSSHLSSLYLYAGKLRSSTFNVGKEANRKKPAWYEVLHSCNNIAASYSRSLVMVLSFLGHCGIKTVELYIT
jgi:hypothetical protein